MEADRGVADPFIIGGVDTHKDLHVSAVVEIGSACTRASDIAPAPVEARVGIEGIAIALLHGSAVWAH